MPIRLMNPHAQSKEPCTPARASAVSGSSPGIANNGWTTDLFSGDAMIQVLRSCLHGD
jgi:hypothetical protein